MEKQQTIEEAYRQVSQRALEFAPPPNFHSVDADYAAGFRWRFDKSLIDLVPGGVANRVILDFGAKYGHAAPLFLTLGATATIHVDVIEDYVEFGRKIIGALYPDRTTFMRVDGCFLDLPQNSVDVIVVNEVISHINPAYLDTFYSEAARILAPGGYLLISDGNNWANDWVRSVLPNLWDAWENGPKGRKTDRDVVTESYLELRRAIARSTYPGLEPAAADRFARNTSGMFGDELVAALNKFAEQGVLIERPYRYGTVCTNPGPGGTVMERPFHPDDVVRALELHALDAKQVWRQPHDPRGRLRRTLSACKQFVLSGFKRPRGRTAGDDTMFQILATKR